MNMKINKRAQTGTILNWIFYKLPIIVIVGVFFILVLRSYYDVGLSTHNTENIILMKRLLYSDNLLAYQDEVSKRVYPGIIDIDKFTTTNLEENLENKNNRLAVNLELINLETEESSRAYINEDRARAWDDYENLGGYESSYLRRSVKIYDDNEIYEGILIIKVLVKI